MRIIGGSFGTRGRVEIGEFGIRIKASRHVLYPPGTLTQVTARQHRERGFAALSFLLGLIILGGLAGLIFGPIGFLAALLLCLVGSFYGKTRYLVDMSFKDGEQLTLETTRRQADQLVQLKQ